MSIYKKIIFVAGIVLFITIGINTAINAIFSGYPLAAILISLVIGIVLLSWSVNMWINKPLTDNKIALDLKEITVSRDALFKEIEERKRVEEELKNAYKKIETTQNQLIQSAKMASIGQLAGGVAHEVNNPLTGILNNTQLIKILAAQRKDFNMVYFKELLDSIEESAIRCRNIIRALMDFSRVPTGAFMGISLNEVIRKVLDVVSYEMKLQNIDIQTEFDKNLPFVSGDFQLLQQVVFGVISNARWAVQQKTGEHEKIIRLITRNNRAKRAIDILISDTGVGIPKENLNKIFEPFFTTKQVGEGTGLGLSLAYNIIKEHKGTIEAQSDPGKGSTFKISLPVMA